MRLGSIITSAKIDPDPMYNGPSLCKTESCELARGNKDSGSFCPSNAIGPAEEKVLIGEKEFTVARIDKWRCTWGSMGLSKSSGGLKNIPMPESVGPNEIFNALKERDPAQSMELMVIGRGDYCGRCIIECPVGRSKKLDQMLSQATQGKDSQQ